MSSKSKKLRAFASSRETKKEEAKPALVPKLRFPEFREAEGWEQKTGDRLFDQINERNPQPGLPVLAITQEHGAIPRHMIDYHVSVTEKSIESYKVVQVGDFIISLRSFQGGIEYSQYHGICSPAYVILRKRGEASDAYFKYYLKTDRFIQILTKNLEGLRDGKMVSYAQFSELLVPVPPPAEQQKIAECLSSVDELMAAQARKVDALKTHKKGLMQQLFPREGETQPRLRFPEFQNAGEWEERRFDKVFDRLKTKNTISEQNVLTISAQEGLVSQLEYFNKSVSSKDISGYQLLRKGDFAYNKSYSQGYPWGAIKPLKRYDAGVVSPLYICFRLRDNITHSGSFFEQYFDAGCLDSELENIAQEGARNHGMLNIGILDFFDRNRVWIPRLKEQQRIATCLSSLDALITAETQKHEALKTHKKGLMQQLFPSPEDPNS